MRLVSNDYGDEFPIIGSLIEVETSGRVISILTNERGRFSVPISIGFPFFHYTFVLYPDLKSKKQVDIKIPFSNSYLGRSKLIYSKKENSYKVVPKGIIDKAGSYFSFISLFSKVYADENVKEYRDKDAIDDEVLKAISTVTKIPIENISLQAFLFGDLKLDNYDLSYINSRLKKRFQIDVLKSLWQSAKTVKDIIDIARVEYKKKHK